MGPAVISTGWGHPEVQQPVEPVNKTGKGKKKRKAFI